ncbi:MAG TPA: DMT family transporter [Burkholderiales bacterium]|jgi:drug/metabolite transporter (DMT)-like permease|nr:DMT family transporter [Burkholderiales bacterium]
MTTLPRSLWALLALLTLAWGLNWPMMKLALAELPVWTFRGACVAAGSIGLFAIARTGGLPLRIARHQRWRVAVTAFFNITLWNVLIGYGLTLLPSGRAAILAYTMPLWTVLLSICALNEPLTTRRIAGLALGLAGLALLLGTELAVLRAAPVGALLVLGAAVSWAIGTVLMKRYPTDLPTTAFVAWQLAIGGLPIVLGALVLDWGAWRPISVGPTIGLLYNMFVAFIFCHWAWFKIATSAPAGVASLSTMMIPVVGVFSGMLVLGEQPKWPEFAALGLVLLALATVLVPQRIFSR